MQRGRRRGGRSEWERHQQVLRREIAAECRTGEFAARAVERQALHTTRHLEQARAAAQILLAKKQTLAVQEFLRELETVLISALDRTPTSFENLRLNYVEVPFDPGPLATPVVMPDASEFLPEQPHGLGRILSVRHQRDRNVAKEWYLETLAVREQREQDRLRALAAAKSAHALAVAEAQARAQARNAEVTRARAAFEQREVDGVEWFVRQVLGHSCLPAGFPRRCKTTYLLDTRRLVVEVELPPQDLIPPARAYRYVKARDAIEPVRLPKGQIKQRYADLIAQSALRSLHEIFSATPADVIDTVVLNGCVTTTDRATGKKVRSHLLTIDTDRTRFTELVLRHVDPAACLKHLSALISPNPFDLEAVEPLIDFDLARFRFMDNQEIAASLDSRPNLLDLSPTEFEHLVRELFVAMGAETWNTLPSKDGGVDAVAVSRNVFFGGVCLVQAKRSTKVIRVQTVHALTGVMTDHNASTGVLVTTSWFGRASEEFAARNRIRLINGAELKHLVKEHLHVDVVPGTDPPRQRRSQADRA
jgi:restriction system protein